MRVSLLSAAVLFFAVTTGNSQETAPQTAGDYFNLCKSLDSPRRDAATIRNQSFCNGFFTGYHFGLVEGGSPGFCLPGSVTAEELERAFLKYVRENPSAMHEGIFVGLRRAFKIAYPCKGKR